VLVAYATAKVASDHLNPGSPRPLALRQGLFAWDGAFYRDIAEKGYRALPAEAVRFFPLYPLAGRVLGWVLGGATAAALLIIANGSALVALVLVRRLAEREVGHAYADGSAWWVAVWPAAFVLVFAYAEALYLVLALLVLLWLRSRRWLPAAAAGVLAALTRPVGVLLALAAAVEAARGWSAATARERVRRVVAVAAPIAGLVSFLVYSAFLPTGWRGPLREQQALRGHTVEPITRTLRAIHDLVRSGHLTDGLHAPFAVVLIVLVVLAFRWLPVSLALYSAAVVALALAADNLNSLERYGLNAVPLMVVLAIATRRWRVEQPALIVSGGMLVAITTLAWLGAYVP
jgi:hypothetical protein